MELYYSQVQVEVSVFSATIIIADIVNQLTPVGPVTMDINFGQCMAQALRTV